MDRLLTTAEPSLSTINGTYSNGTDEGYCGEDSIRPLDVIFVSLEALICIVGLIGNGLVIFVVLRYTKMMTVTNMYILNLAVADLCFLVGIPFLIVTTVARTWVFGFYICKLFFICTSINWFTSVFLLTVMSGDRYLAVCHPVRSMSYRTPLVARVVCVCVWCLSLLVMLPIVLYAMTVSSPCGTSCTILWPEGQPISADRAFIWYAFILGFAIPVALIVVFYVLVIMRLKTVGPKVKSKEKKRSHKKVTVLVLVVITAYVVCWAPYWGYQVTLTFATVEWPRWTRFIFQAFTIFSYANSMLNPLLYAFLSDNFRKSFIKAFKCATKAEVNGELANEHSVVPSKKSGIIGNTNSTTLTLTTTAKAPHQVKTTVNAKPEEEIEFTTTKISTQNNDCSAEDRDCDNNEKQDETKLILANHEDIKNEIGDGKPTDL